METYERTSQPKAASMGRAVAMALAVFAIALVGTYFVATSESESAVETTVPDTETTESGSEPAPADQEPAEGEQDDGSDASDGAEPVDSEPPIGVETELDRDLPVNRFIDEGAGDFGFEGDDSIVHGTDGFASLRWVEGELVARRSPDGLDWTETPTTGLPDEAGLRSLLAAGDRFVAVLEQYPRYDEGDEPARFTTPEASTYHVATSPDLIEWTASTLPAIDPPVQSEYGSSVFLADVAVGDTGVVAVYTAFANPPNEFQILVEAGILGEDDFESYCGFDWESFDSGEPVSIYTCDYTEFEAAMAELEEQLAAAESDEETDRIEAEFDRAEPVRVEIAEIEPGTELYDRLFEAGPGQGPPEIATVVQAGPPGGPYSTRQLEVTGNPTGVVATDGGYVLLVTDFAFDRVRTEPQSSSRILRSSDGLTWTEPETISVDGGLWGIEAAGELIVASGGSDDGGQLTLVSTDGGETWGSAPDFGADLYGTWVIAVGGPAGMAVWVEGSTEPYPEYPPLVLSVEKDGYILEIILEEDLLLLTGPDGEVVHELRNLDELIGGSGGVPGVVREDPDDVVTFLDPETGDDLVSYTEEDLEVAYQASEERADYVYVEPPRSRRIWFSADGADWSALDVPPGDAPNSYSRLAAVGDDEVLVSTTTWLEPPDDLFAFEFEDREPTDAEMEAIDAWYTANDGGSSVEWVRLPVG